VYFNPKNFGIKTPTVLGLEFYTPALDRVSRYVLATYILAKGLAFSGFRDNLSLFRLFPLTMFDILQKIPHRPPFLFVDRVVDLSDTVIKTQRGLRADEDFFSGHYPGNPIMPGVLMCEAVFQSAAILLVHRLEAAGESIEGKTPVLSRITEAKFKNMARPGDLLDIEVTWQEAVKNFQFLRGVVRHEGKLVLTVSCALALLDGESA
jgi:3-hydroxyacyl-[acyl-carrier-protein] dehydratase